MTPVEALQAALAGEHAAVYVYGVVGGRVSYSAEPDLWNLVRAAYALHRGRRDELVTMVRGMDAEPVAAEVSYELPNAATSPAQLKAAALETEQRAAAVYADVVGSTAGASRLWAIDALEDAAVRALGFGGEPSVFPGIDDL
jgi:hypothetical protein